MIRRPPRSTRTDTLFPYTTLFRSGEDRLVVAVVPLEGDVDADLDGAAADGRDAISAADDRTRDDRRASAVHMTHERGDAAIVHHLDRVDIPGAAIVKDDRSAERRVGKECVSTCRSGWSRDH